MLDKARNMREEEFDSLKQEIQAVRRQVSPHCNMANSNYDAISAEFDGTKLEFKAVYEDMDILVEDMRGDISTHIATLREEFFDEVGDHWRGRCRARRR